MQDITDFADNLVLHLQRDNRHMTFTTTGVKGQLKVVDESRTSLNASYIASVKEVRHIFLDSVVNGWKINANLLFPSGLLGVAKELAAEYKQQQEAKEQEAKEHELTKEEELPENN